MPTQPKVFNKSGMRRSLFDVASVALVAAAVQMVALPAHAQSTTNNDSGVSDKTSQQFSQMDKNRDAYIDRQEAAGMPSLIAMFDKADSNRDGKLSSSEYAAAQSQAK